MDLLLNILLAAWRLLLDASAYVLFGLLVSGLLRVFLSPNTVTRHLGRGRFSSVFKAALLGIPIPLCSCGVLPAAVGLRKQGANKGAAAAFLISTPESGVDSMAVTYALLDPIMTVARPVSALVTATAAGLTANLVDPDDGTAEMIHDLSCPVDGCCDGVNCSPAEHRRHHTLGEKLKAGFKFALSDVWGDMAPWFWLGMILAGVIDALLPPELLGRFLGGGLSSMLLMLAVGIPLYICATASTPIAASLILKGVSPGAALVFLLAGPATNITSLTVLIHSLGRRTTVIYLACIALISVACGLALDWIYALLAIDPRAIVGQAGEIIPVVLQWAGAVILLLLSVKPLAKSLLRLSRRQRHEGADHDAGPACAAPT